jgi:hypothetical protein
MPGPTIEEVIANNSDALLELPGVAGVALGEEGARTCIVVMLAVDSEKVRNSIPRSIDGYPVSVRITGELRTQ